ncbi:MAG: hypothetical protein KatS3mg031_2388 [Chitinophagales bacterium]|nr:MAG: hypothetical protein KatS3mg031_2388 [Chitinophagales bacterium]
MDRPLKFFFIVTGVFVLLAGIIIVLMIFSAPQENRLPRIEEQHPLMIHARQQARQTLDTFVALYAQYPNQAFVRFSFEPVPGHVEHLWAKVLKVDSLMVTAELLHKGEADEVFYPPYVALHLLKAEDWLIELPDGTIRGGFTTQAILLMDRNNPSADTAAISQRLKPFSDRLHLGQ